MKPLLYIFMRLSELPAVMTQHRSKRTRLSLHNKSVVSVAQTTVLHVPSILVLLQSPLLWRPRFTVVLVWHLYALARATRKIRSIRDNTHAISFADIRAAIVEEELGTLRR